MMQKDELMVDQCKSLEVALNQHNQFHGLKNQISGENQAPLSLRFLDTIHCTCWFSWFSRPALGGAISPRFWWPLGIWAACGPASLRGPCSCSQTWPSVVGLLQFGRPCAVFVAVRVFSCFLGWNRLRDAWRCLFYWKCWGLVRSISVGYQ